MTQRIKIVINDQRIWNPLKIGAEIGLALAKGNHVILDMAGEAPTLRFTELPKLLKWLKSQDIDLNMISIDTGNPLEDILSIKTNYKPEWMFELEVIKKETVSWQTKDIKYHFGCMIGRSTMPRLVISAHIYKYHRSKSWQTFHWCDRYDYHTTHISLEDIIRVFGIHSKEFDMAVELLKSAPLIKNPVDHYPILQPTNRIDPLKWYQAFFVDIVCETWWQGKNFFMTEKFWRCVLTRTPFVFHGSQRSLEYLKELGFKTFDQWWPENYDLDYQDYENALEDGAYQNIESLLSVIDFIGTWDIKHLNAVYDDMKPVLDHNYKRMMEITYQDFQKFFFNHRVK